MPLIESCIATCLLIAFLSLVCSAVQEVIAKICRMRGQCLVQGLAGLLGRPGSAKGVWTALMEHPLIKSLARDGNVREHPPSVIPAMVFADAVLDIVSVGSTATTRTLDEVRGQLSRLPSDDPARHVLVAILDVTEQAGGDLRGFRGRLAEHYDCMMQRVTGWYKRRVASFLLGIALVVAASTNADFFGMTRAVWTNSALRASLEHAAVGFVSQPVKPGLGASADLGRAVTLAEVQHALEGVALPLGWERNHLPNGGLEWFVKVVGILVTAAAMSLGAPFWFDALRMLLSLRSKDGVQGAAP